MAGMTHKYIDLKPFDETEWSSFIEKNKKNVKIHCSEEYLVDGDKDASFKWIQDTITITISITLEIPENEIQCDENGIKSSKLNGEWWDKINNLEIVSVGELTQITFETEYEWPTLIKGGKPDGYSAFYLAIIALELKNSPFCECWLKYASIQGNHSAQVSYVLNLFDQERYEEAIHWLSRCILMFSDDMCGYLLANLLLEGKGYTQNAPIAEFILCRLSLQGFPSALTLLGKVYLNGYPGVKKEPQRAKMLFQIASIKFEDEEARKILDTADFSESVQTDSEVQPKEEEVEKEEKKHEPTIFDYAIAGGVIASIFVLGYFSYKRFYRRK